MSSVGTVSIFGQTFNSLHDSNKVLFTIEKQTSHPDQLAISKTKIANVEFVMFLLKECNLNTIKSQHEYANLLDKGHILWLTNEGEIIKFPELETNDSETYYIRKEDPQTHKKTISPMKFAKIVVLSKDHQDIQSVRKDFKELAVLFPSETEAKESSDKKETDRKSPQNSPALNKKNVKQEKNCIVQ